MIFGSESNVQICHKLLHTLAEHARNVAISPNMTLDDRMKTVQWLSKKYIEINKLLIRIKTEGSNVKR